MSQPDTKVGRFTAKAIFLLVAILILVGCARRVRPIIGSPITGPYSQDISLDELLLLYQKEQAALPPLIGLMEASVSDSLLKRFWAKWSSHSGQIEIEGFDLLGGSLFDFQWKRQPTGQLETGSPETDTPEIIFTVPDSGKEFVGSRKGFKRYLDAQTKPEMRMEWLTLLDWVARGGLPHVALLMGSTSTAPYRPALEKQKDQFVLYFFMEKEQNPVLMQKVLIEPKSLRVTEALFFDPTGAMEAQISFRDYRYVGRSGRSNAASTDRVLFPFLITIQGETIQGEIEFKELKIVELPMSPDSGANLSPRP